MEKLPLAEVHVDELLAWCFENGKSELYLEAGYPPRSRAWRASSLDELDHYEILSPPIAQRIVYDILRDDEIMRLESHNALMLRYVSADGAMTFNVHVAYYGGNIDTVFHLISPQ